MLQSGSCCSALPYAYAVPALLLHVLYPVLKYSTVLHAAMLLFLPIFF
jgi:hypothetical protein